MPGVRRYGARVRGLATRSALVLGVALLAGLIGCGETAKRPASRTTGEQLWRDAVWQMDSHSFRDALPYLERAVDAADGEPDRGLLFLIGSAYLFEGYAEPAANFIDPLRYGPPAPEPMLLDGWELARSHERPTAELAFTACLDRTATAHPFADELTFLAWFWRGEERLASGNLEGAVRDLDAAYKLLRDHEAPPNRRLVRALADAHRFSGDVAAAAALMRDATSRDLTWAPFAYDLGILLAAQAHPDEAHTWFLASLDRDPKYPAPYIELARDAWEAGDLEAMRRHLDRYGELTNADALLGRDPRAGPTAAEIASGMGLYWTERGKLHLAEGEDENAAVAFGLAKDGYRRALELTPTCTRALYRLILLGTLSGEDDTVIQRWKQALDEIEARDGATPRTPAVGDGGRTFC